MIDDNLRLFTSEDELKSFCKVYGYDEGLTDATIARWKSLIAEPLTSTSKTIITAMEPDAIESKDETDLTE